ncbi:MAG: J domain-containing protein [Thermodesulfobacteriota bacterium]
MTKKDWKKIDAARKVLGLGEKATLAEIKEAYRFQAKRNHPDLAAGGREAKQKQKCSMQEITDAYQVLLAYCKNFSYPLVRPDNEEVDPEDWWMDRFGQDPLWSRK